MHTIDQAPISTDDALGAVIIRRKPHPDPGLDVTVTVTDAIPAPKFVAVLRELHERFATSDGTPAGDPVIIDGREALGAVLIHAAESADGQPTADVSAFTAGLPHHQLAEQLLYAIEELEEDTDTGGAGAVRSDRAAVEALPYPEAPAGGGRRMP